MEFAKWQEASTTVDATARPIPMMKSVRSCNSVMSETSNGMSNIWSESLQSTTESLGTYEDDDRLFALQRTAESEDMAQASRADSLDRGLSDRDIATPLKPGRPVSDFRKYKTTLCRSWMASTVCMFGADCIFAHGEAELRSETNNETLKLANELLGGIQERVPRRRTRRRHRKKSAVSGDGDAGEEEEEAEGWTGSADGGEADGNAAPSTPLSAPSPPPSGSGLRGPPPAASPTNPAPAPGMPPALSGAGSPRPEMGDCSGGPCGCPCRRNSCGGRGDCLQRLYARLQWLEEESALLRQYLALHLQSNPQEQSAESQPSLPPTGSRPSPDPLPAASPAVPLRTAERPPPCPTIQPLAPAPTTNPIPNHSPSPSPSIMTCPPTSSFSVTAPSRLFQFWPEGMPAVAPPVFPQM